MCVRERGGRGLKKFGVKDNAQISTLDDSVGWGVALNELRCKQGGTRVSISKGEEFNFVLKQSELPVGGPSEAIQW